MLKVAAAVFVCLLIGAPILLRLRPRWVAAFNLVVTNRISNNVGGVKQVLSDTCVCTHGRAPFRSLSWFARFQPGLALNRSGQDSVRPSHLFDHLPRSRFASSNSLTYWERDAQSLHRCSTAHHRDFRALPRVSPGATSSTDAPPAFAPSLPWRSCVPAAWRGGRTCCATPADCAP